MEIYIRRLDRFGNLVPGLHEFDADVIEKETNLSIPIPDIYFEEVSPGTQLFSFSAVESGDFLLTIFDDKQKKSISNVPYDFTVFVGRYRFPEPSPLCVYFAGIRDLPVPVFDWTGYCNGSNSVVNGSGLNGSTAGEVVEFSIYLTDLFQYPSPVELQRVRVQIVREIDSYHVQPSIYPLQLTNSTYKTLEEPNFWSKSNFFPWCFLIIRHDFLRKCAEEGHHSELDERDSSCACTISKPRQPCKNTGLVLISRTN